MKPFDSIISSIALTVSTFRADNINIDVLQRLSFHNAFPQPAFPEIQWLPNLMLFISLHSLVCPEVHYS